MTDTEDIRIEDEPFLTDDPPPKPADLNGSRVQSRGLLSDDGTVEVVASADDVDYEPKPPKRLTAAMLNALPREFPEFDFKLTHTGYSVGEPIVARVRIINLTERAVLTSVPVEIRKLVQKLFFAGGATTNQNKKQVAEVQMENSLKRLKEVCYAYGVAGFLDPRLVLNQSDVKDPDKEAWVGSIAMADLQEFVRICEGEDQLAARRLEGFSLG